MKSIEISTAHNIVVTSDLASVVQRMMAWLIDMTALGIYSGLVASVFGGVTALMYILVFLVMAFYHLVMEIFNEGQSLGKMLLKIRVVSIQGMAPSPQDYFLRWIFRLVDIPLTLGALGLLTMMSSSKNQRAGDLLARTAVVSLRSRKQVDLDSIQNLNRQDLEINYPTIVQYSDRDMLLVKQTLQRYHQKSTVENTRLLHQLKDRICHDLHIKSEDEQAPEFLKRILADYILLKR